MREPMLVIFKVFRRKRLLDLFEISLIMKIATTRCYNFLHIIVDMEYNHNFGNCIS